MKNSVLIAVMALSALAQGGQAVPVQTPFDGFKKGIQEKALRDYNDAEAARNPATRRQLISILLMTIEKNEENIERKNLVVADSLLRLRKIGASEVASEMVLLIGFEKFDFWVNGKGYSKNPSANMEERYPAIGVIASGGREILSAIVESASLSAQSEVFCDNAIYILRQMIDNKSNEPLRRFLMHYASEKDLQSRRLKELGKADISLFPTLSVTHQFERQQESNLKLSDEDAKRVNELILLLKTNQYKDNLEKERAMSDLSQFKTVKAVHIFSNQLDFAGKEGEFPTISALVNIGEPALPAIADAIATRGRSELFRNNGLQAMLQILKTPEAVSAALLGFADENEKKAQRLRDLAASLPKQN